MELKLRGLQAFRAVYEATGDATSGTVTISFNLNAGGTPSKFFALSQIRAYNNDLANAQNVQVYPTINHFTRGQAEGGSLAIPVTVSADLAISTSFAYTEILPTDRSVYLGEAIAASQGTINVRFETNTDTKKYGVEMIGLESYRPFVVPELGAF
jgi:hypothetical protein